MDPDHQNHYLGVGSVIWLEFGKRGPPGARRLLLWKYLVSSFHQIQEERSQTQGGKTSVYVVGKTFFFCVGLVLHAEYKMVSVLRVVNRTPMQYLFGAKAFILWLPLAKYC